MKKLLLALLLIVGGYQFAVRSDWHQPADATAPAPSSGQRLEADDGATVIARAFEQQRSDLQVQGTGTVQKILEDDNHGSRHQRFIVRLSSGQTVLIAHNIDLAPRIEALREGDAITFFGEYEWNNKGGVIHWTHHDPRGRHVGGWLEHEGRRYE